MYRFVVVVIFVFFLDLLSSEVDFSFTECARFCSAVQHVLLPLSSLWFMHPFNQSHLTFLLVFLCFADIHTIHIFLFIFFLLVFALKINKKLETLLFLYLGIHLFSFISWSTCVSCVASGEKVYFWLTSFVILIFFFNGSPVYMWVEVKRGIVGDKDEKALFSLY